jgi:hemerythrin-like domain-containing protein
MKATEQTTPLARPESGRERIRREHRELRRQLREIELLLARWDAGAEGAGVALRNGGLTLYQRLGRHIDMEESILVPALSAIEGGEARARQLAAEHQEQRELLAFLRSRMNSPRPTVLVVRELTSFVAYLREDMESEDHALDGLELAS